MVTPFHDPEEDKLRDVFKEIKEGAKRDWFVKWLPPLFILLLILIFVFFLSMM